MEKIDVKVFNNSNNDLPKYETEFSAGLDVRADYSKIDNINDFIGNNGYYFDKDNDGNLVVVLEPQGRILIPTNLHPAIPDGYEIQVRPRSGLALKHGITVVNTPGTVDCFTKDSKITTINGDKTINELTITDILLSYNEQNDIYEKDEIVAIVDTGEQDVVEITTNNGVLKVTSNSKIYTKNGLKLAKDLSLDDEILIN